MKSLGLISIAFYILALVYLLIKWPVDKSKTFSQNVVRSTTSIIYYAIMFVIFLTLLCIFMWGWFFPTFKISKTAEYTFLLGVIAQLIAVFIPETDGLKKIIHLIAAGIMSLSVLFFTALLTLNQNISMSARVVTAITASFMFLCWLLVIFYKKIYKFSLILQSLYFMIFFIAILSITFLI